MTVEAVDLGDAPLEKPDYPRTLLILSDGLVLEEIQDIASKYIDADRVVILDEEKRFAPWGDVLVKDDFTTAMYVAAWPTETP
jgi:hypothetical protein